MLVTRYPSVGDGLNIWTAMFVSDQLDSLSNKQHNKNCLPGHHGFD
jgi:hypothetical protein